MDNPFESPITISICSGIRGLERGIERVIGNLRVVTYVEIEAFLIYNLIAGMEAGVLVPSPVWTDVKTFPFEQFRGKVQFLIGGYPCTPFSLSGKRAGTDDPRHLWPYIKRGIAAARPVCCFFENVPGHLTLGLETVIRDLRHMGYAVEAELFTAAEVGASQVRERIFIFAMEHTAREQLHRCIEHSGGWAKFAEAGYQLADAAGGPAERTTTQVCEANGQQEGGQFPEPHISGDELGNTVSQQGREASEGELELGGDALHNAGRQKNTDRFKSPGKNGGKLADPDGKGLPVAGQAGQRQLSTEDRKEFQHRTEQCSHQLAISHGQGLEGNGAAGQQESCSPVTKKLSGRHGTADRWPARPGQQQFDWEHRRTIITNETAKLLGGYSKKYPESFSKRQIDQFAADGFTGRIKSGLGLTINGYRFREDLLRALGNAVVEQQAEAAFRYLLKKIVAF